jgi:uncharacterized protein YndB with AHSA1/START domain
MTDSNSMTGTEALKITTPSDREIAITRVFAAPRKLVFEALTTPAFVKRWLLGPPGWSMPVCEMDVRAGGAYRWVWRNDSDGRSMGVSGVFREVAPPQRLVATEKFDEAWYPGEAIVTNALAEENGKTTLTLSVLYESKEARDVALKSGMEKGIAVSYDRLAQILAEKPA